MHLYFDIKETTMTNPTASLALDFTPRRGLATLELVMALPVMLTLVVALVWLGFSIVGQAEVNVEARDAAWQKRFDRWGQSPFDFVARQRVEESEQQTVDVTPLLSGLPGPKNQHAVETSTWGHRSNQFEKLPNLALYADVASAAKTAGMKSSFRDLKSAFVTLENAGDQIHANISQQILEGLSTPTAALESLSVSSEQRLELDKQLGAAKIKDALVSIKREIRELENQIDNLKDDDELGRWIRKRALERFEIQQKLLESND
jgi:hypothetical protein